MYVSSITFDFWVCKVDGVRMNGFSGSVDLGTSGRKLMIEHASDKKVVSTSLVKLLDQ